jgi:hypothetical protein
MVGEPCGYLVVSDAKGNLAKLHLEDEVAKRLLSDGDIDALLARIDDSPAPKPAPAQAATPPLVPAERLALLPGTLAATLLRAEVAAARLPVFRKILTAMLGRALALAKEPRLAKALKEAIARLGAGAAPTRAEIEAMATFLPWPERYPLAAQWGRAMHEATFAELKTALAANKDLAGWRLATDRSLGSLIPEIVPAATRARAQKLLRMSVEDVLTEVVGRAAPGTREARLDQALIKAFGTNAKTGQPIRLEALRPDILVLDRGGQVRGLFDLTSLGEGPMQAAAQLAAEELRAFDAFAELRKLSPQAAGKSVLASTKKEAGVVVLKRAKELHARRLALIQSALAELDLAGALQGGEFYYSALRVWGPPVLP